MTVFLIPLLYLAGTLEFWLLLGLVFFGSALDTPGGSARAALIPNLAREAGMTLERANSAFQAVPRLALLVGPPLDGVLIAIFGAADVLLVDAATFAFSAALVTFLVPSPERSREAHLEGEASVDREGASTRGYLSELAEGVRFIVGSPLIISILVVVTVVNLLDEPLVSVVLPVYAKSNFGSAVGLGLLLGAFGAGALAGTILFGAVGHRLPRRITFIVSFVAAGGLEYLVLLAALPLSLIVGAFALGGILAGSLDPIISTVLQERVPEGMRGRVFGLTHALAMVGTPLGAALGGFLVEGLGLVPTLMGMAGCYLAVTLGMFFNSALREMDVPVDMNAGRSDEPASEEAANIT